MENYHPAVLKALSANDMKLAKSLSDSWLKAEPSAMAYYCQGLIMANIGQVPAAIRAATKALELGNNASHQAFLASLYVNQKQYEYGLRHYRASLQLRPRDVETLNNLAALYHRMGQYQNAIDTLHETIAINANYWPAHFNLANALMRLDQNHMAKNHYLKVIELNPEHYPSQVNLAILQYDFEDYQAASLGLKTCLAHTFDANHAYFLGLTEQKLGNMEAATWAFKQALANPQQLDAHHNLAIIYLQQGQKDLASLHFKAELAIDPRRETAKFMLAALNNQQGQFGEAPLAHLSDLFDQYASFYNQHVKTLNYQVPHLLRQLITSHSKQSFKKALDLGCGTGLVGLYFQDICHQIEGIDLSSAMVNQARLSKLYKNVHHGEFRQWLTNNKESWDLVIAADVLNYLGDLENSLNLISDRLHNSGLFLFSLELDSNAHNYCLQVNGRFGHNTNYVKALMHEAGLCIIIQTEAQLREQQGQAVLGLIYLCQKQIIG